ncbi:hypothetical protein S40293_11185 [Stachybotrys chartarum IBT 40293]|nr:hypothetical protein S40293_11185 [Stachybotrys chartarum IBT 40293]
MSSTSPEDWRLGDGRGRRLRDGAGQGGGRRGRAAEDRRTEPGHGGGARKGAADGAGAAPDAGYAGARELCGGGEAGEGGEGEGERGRSGWQ